MNNWLRWLAVLPGAILAAALSSFPLHLVLYATLSNFIEPYPEIPERVLLPFVAAMAFLWAGAKIAPTHRFETSVVLFGLWLALWGAVVALTLYGAEIAGRALVFQGGALGPIAAVVGALTGLYVTRREHGQRTSTT